MAIKTWTTDGKTFFKIDVCARSRANRTLRVQKRESGVLDEKDPESARRKLNRIQALLADEARREIAEREGAGITWGDLVKRWEKALEEEYVTIRSLMDRKRLSIYTPSPAHAKVIDDKLREDLSAVKALIAESAEVRATQTFEL